VTPVVQMGIGVATQEVQGDQPQRDGVEESSFVTAENVNRRSWRSKGAPGGLGLGKGLGLVFSTRPRLNSGLGKMRGMVQGEGVKRRANGRNFSGRGGLSLKKKKVEEVVSETGISRIMMCVLSEGKRGDGGAGNRKR